MKAILFAFLTLFLVGHALAFTRPRYCGIEPNSYFVLNATAVPSQWQLISLQVLIRHGDRLPIDRCWASDNEWYCDLNIEERSLSKAESQLNFSRIHRKHYLGGEEIFPGRCMAGQLTDYGYKQHLTNGANMRSLYANPSNPSSLLPNKFNPTLVSVRSTDVPRTLQSVQALLRGLYPWGNNLATEFVDVYTVDANKEWLYPNGINCPLLAKYEAAAKTSPEFVQWTNQTLAPLMTQLAAAYGLPLSQMPSPINIFDCLSAHICHKFPVPSGVTQSLFDQIFAALEFEYAYTYNYPSTEKYGRLAMGKFYHEIFHNFAEAVSGHPATKLHIFSAHDTSVMPFLNAIKAWDKKWAPYASNVLMELYRNPSTMQHYVRYIYNGNELTIPGCGGPFCSWADFTQALQPIILKDMDAACVIPPGTSVKPTMYGVYSIDGAL